MTTRALLPLLALPFFFAESAGAVPATSPGTAPIPAPPPSSAGRLAPGAAARAVSPSLTIYCRGGGSNGFSYNSTPNYKFVIAFTPGFQHAGPQFPQFGLTPGQCGFADDKNHSEPNSLCFQTGSLESIRYLGGNFVELKTTPDVVGGMLGTNRVFGFSVRLVDHCLLVDKFEGPFNN
jgi:hypothetical protein